jgi:hypothetical protein
MVSGMGSIRLMLPRWLAFIALGIAFAIRGGGPDWHNSNETAAVRSIQTISSMQTQFMSQFGRYARTLAELGPQGADLIPASLASGEHYGYMFRIASTPAGYQITATPKVPGQTGSRTFHSDQNMVIQ